MHETVAEPDAPGQGDRGRAAMLDWPGFRASLQCALVCKFYGFVKRSRALFMMMERCEGSLAERLRGLGGKGLPEGELACASLL